MINELIAAIIISNLALWGFVWYKFKELAQDTSMDMNMVRGEISVLGNNMYEEIQRLRSEDLAKLRDETPMLEINDQNEAVLYTRNGKEIHNFKLSKK
tara:strand:+ start:29601 stop:29894 length:294 start_codon:yes stop_codon:yes gene_type:complete